MKIFNLFKIERIKNAETEVSVGDELLKILVSDETIDRKMALDIPIINSCVGLICDTFATIPFKLYKKTTNGDRLETKEIDDSRTRIINYDTKDTLDGFQFKKAICEDYLLGKGGYAYIKKRKNDFIGLNYVEEKYITIFKNTDKINKSFEITVDGITYKNYEFIKLLRNSKDGASGEGLIDNINKSLQTAYQRILLEKDLMKTCGNKKGFLRAMRHLDKEGMNTLRKEWNDYYAGNSSCVILNDGMEFKEASNTSVENQLNEKTKTFSDEMKELFHIKDDYNSYIREAIIPIVKAFCTALNRDFLLEKEKEQYYFDADLNDLLKGNLKERFEAYKIAIEKGFLSRNEVRFKENMNSVKGLDVYTISLGEVMLDPKTQIIYTPNTDSTKKFNEGGEEDAKK